MSDFDVRYSALRRAVIENEFEKLNDMQKKAVFKTEGPVLLLAGAGSGKTTVLINRVINLLRFGRGYECETAPDWAGDGELARLAQAVADPGALSESELLRLCSVDAPRPWEIIAITFTNKAAGELRDRLNVACGRAGGRPVGAHLSFGLHPHPAPGHRPAGVFQKLYHLRRRRQKADADRHFKGPGHRRKEV